MSNLEDEDDGALHPKAKTAKPAATEPRQDMRPLVRDDDPRARAAARAAELRDHLGGLDEGSDEFYIDPHEVPDGWSYEWKRKSVFGAEDPAYQVHLARTGWQPVPADRHPSFMPEGGGYKTIERKGMVLMERPLEITEEVRAIERGKARNQMRQKEEQLGMAPAGQFDRQNKDAPMAKIKRSYEAPIPIPE